jgi:hypothetical protein
MKRLSLLFVLTAVFLVPASAETHLSGDIKSAVLDSSGNPYIVDQDVVVPSGKKLLIKEGCVFLFKGFTGLNVSGQMHVAGSSKRPVIFTSVNDGDYNPKSDQLPNPFDWNGILVAKESQGALLENFQLRYSVYGVKSQTTNVSIQNGVFRQNGQFHFTINEKIQYVQDNIPFSYSGGAAEAEKPSVSASGETGVKPSTQAKKSKQSPVVFRYTSLGVGLVGIAAGSIMLIPWNDTKKELNLSNFAEKYPLDPDAKWKELNGNLTGWGAGSIASYTLGLLGLVGFGISFAF